MMQRSVRVGLAVTALTVTLTLPVHSQNVDWRLHNLDLAGITVDSDSIDGDHDLVVKRLATAGRITSQGFDDSNATPIFLRKKALACWTCQAYSRG